MSEPPKRAKITLAELSSSDSPKMQIIRNVLKAGLDIEEPDTDRCSVLIDWHTIGFMAPQPTDKVIAIFDLARLKQFLALIDATDGKIQVIQKQNPSGYVLVYSVSAEEERFVLADMKEADE